MLICMASVTTAGAQQLISGVVRDFKTREPIEMVAVYDQLGGAWAVSDADGVFSIRLDPARFELHFRYLGKEEVVCTPAALTTAPTLEVFLKDNNLHLEEVTVVADRLHDKTGSSIVLDKHAVEQFQAFSLAEILTQLPGQAIQAPVLNQANVISLRTAAPNTNNAFGVSFIVDDMPVSNDANMQSYNNTATAGGGVTKYDNVSTGVDLRSIPASNIEEVEVISGIPDARYGNLTSGLVKINRKAGESPLTAAASIRQGTASVSLNKGVNLGGRRGTLSVGLDYLHANEEPASSFSTFNRLTADVIWSTRSRNNRIKNTLSLTLRGNFDNMKYDADQDDGGQDARYKKERGLNLSNRFDMTVSSRFADRVGVQAGLSLSTQESYTQSFVNDGGKVVPVATETALQPGLYTPVAYLQTKHVYGAPVNVSARVDIGKSLKTGELQHNISYGTDVALSDNLGKGRMYDAANASAQVTVSSNSAATSAGEGMRGVRFDQYVRPQLKLGVYVQDNMTLSLAGTRMLYINAGLRFDSQGGYSSAGPRLNMAYEFSPQLKVRGGLGFSAKAPSLNDIYPGDQYFDVLIADFRTNYYAYNLVQTYKKAIPRQQLSAARSWKYEVGTDADVHWGRLSLTAFYNRSYQGFASRDVLASEALPTLQFTFANEQTPPTYVITGHTPYVISYSLKTNSQQVIDKGLEMYLNFKQIKAIRTTLSLSGTYTQSTSHNQLPVLKKNSDPLDTEVRYGYHESLPTVSDMIRLRLTVTHHIPAIGMLTSLTVEQFTRSSTAASAAGIYPYAYLNSNLDYITIPEDQRADNRYQGIRQAVSSTTDTVIPTYHNFHLRVTKEMLNGLSVSLYANNFLFYQPFVLVNGSYLQQNESISFGANMKYTF